MDYFSYPLDTKALLRKRLAIKNELLQQDVNWITKKVAVLGGSTTNEIVGQLELFLLHYGIRSEFYQSEYGKYMEDAVFENPELKAFKPDIVYIHTSWRNIRELPMPSCSEAEISEMFKEEYARFERIWESISEKYGCIIIQNNFDRPNYRLLGNKDVSDIHGRTNYISRLNQKFYEYSQKHHDFFINDIDYIASDFGLSRWSDSRYWYMYKYAMCLESIPYVALSVAKIIKSIYGKNKKALVLDLDNTVWGGIVGDDGVEGIIVGTEIPNGQVYFEFQEYCKAQKSIGVVLGVNSKNDEKNAIAGLNHPDGVLRPEDFVSIKANWLPKDQNLKDMADELSLGLDSFVFIDDNPAEREIVGKQLPSVEVPKISSAENYIKEIDSRGYFEVTALSTEDMNKTEQYRARATAKAQQGAYANYDEYLKSLEMHAVLTEFEDISIQRISQLTNKSNQFNLTTKRCSENEIRAMQNSDDYICFCGRLVDKFADNGIVSVVAAEIIGKELHIRLWLMSCRVLKRGLEDVMMNALVETAKQRGIRTIVGYYYPTSKNGMVKDFYREMGFEILSEDETQNTIWRIDTSEYKVRNTQISVEIPL